ncbi:hypothetical protein SK128_015354, partial [Halocaridina rubra]
MTSCLVSTLLLARSSTEWPANPYRSLCPLGCPSSPRWIPRPCFGRRNSSSASARMADHVFKAVPEDVFLQVWDWSKDQLDQIPFTKLRAYLLQRFTPIAANRTVSIIALSQQSPGDQLPRTVRHKVQ